MADTFPTWDIDMMQSETFVLEVTFDESITNLSFVCRVVVPSAVVGGSDTTYHATVVKDNGAKSIVATIASATTKTWPIGSGARHYVYSTNTVSGAVVCELTGSVNVSKGIVL